ncbi:MAG: L,D-transpeptidase family protein [Gemmatimonadetes bacterium]|nr:L,D-transpeptidase family protein [Gemmatimonadota bacterium]
MAAPREVTGTVDGDYNAAGTIVEQAGNGVRMTGKTPLRTTIVLLLLAIASPAAVPRAAAQGGAAPGAEERDGARPIHEIIRTRIESGSGAVAPIIVVRDERIHSRTELPRFYESRGFMPAWVTDDGPTAAADSLVRTVQQADDEGLEPQDYHLRRIRAVYAEARRARRANTVVDRTRLADLDLLLTDAFLLYGAHLVGGVVNPVTIHPEWNASRREADLVALLDSALTSGAIGGALQTLLPRHPGYGRLRGALARYRAIAAQGGWPEVRAGTLRPGSRSPEVELLRRRLAPAGDLGQDDGPPDVYDAGVEAAVRQFQRRHNLEVDGIAGVATTTVMNTPLEDRVRAVVLNMERWRWLPRDLGQRHVLVNIAGFDLDVVENDSVVFSTRVMVGQRYRKTPVFSDRMTYMVLNPTWTIPPNILEQDKLPLIRQDPAGYLRANRVRVLAPDGREMDPGSVNWATVTGTTRLRLRMDPGPENPLGRVKFMFPNPHHVYLHDTPGRELFDRTRRAFSSGCIRVERPLELAALLLRGDARWTPDRIGAVVSGGGVEQTVQLPRPYMVHLLYWTAWAEPDGTIHFRDDIYERDAVLEEALRLPPPSS